MRFFFVMLAGASSSGRFENRNKLEEGKKERLSSARCGEMRSLVIASGLNTRYGSHEGSYGWPVVVEAGCPLTVEVAASKSVYLVLPLDKKRPLLQFAWDAKSSKEEFPVALFSFREQPTYREQGLETSYDWYWWPLVRKNVKTFREKKIGEDYYHCFGSCEFENLTRTCEKCQEADLRETASQLFLTLSAAPTAGTIEVDLYIDLLDSHAAIRQRDLDILKAIYFDACRPYRRRFEKEDYYYYEGDDPRHKPYCDWFDDDDIIVADLTLNDCQRIPGVLCDAEGYVTQISLTARGLRGPLPGNVSDLSRLEYFELADNRLNGSLPPIFASTSLKRIDLSNNDFVGELPCSSEKKNEALLSISLARNGLTGPLKSCFFENMPKVLSVDLSRNSFFAAAIPQEINESVALNVLDLSNTGISGTLENLGPLHSLKQLKLSHNFLEGNLLSAWPQHLYRLDLGWNLLTGKMPVLEGQSLRIVDLSHNQFYGALTNQFDAFAERQERGLVSKLDIRANDFNGPLPLAFYDLLMDSRYFIYDFQVTDNHFRCEDELSFPDWAANLDHDFGRCEPLPELDAIISVTASAPSIWNDTTLLVFDRSLQGAHLTLRIAGHFEPTTKGKCAFHNEENTRILVSAIFESPSVVLCRLDTLVFKRHTVTVSHYADDFASAVLAFTIQEGTPRAGELAANDPVTPSSRKENTRAMSRAFISIALVAGVAAFLCCCLLGAVLSRELAGNPVLVPLSTNKKQQQSDIWPDDDADTHHHLCIQEGAL